MAHGSTDCGIYATLRETPAVERSADSYSGQLEPRAKWQPVILLVSDPQSFIWILDDAGSGP
jgi:hypothetical protein